MSVRLGIVSLAINDYVDGIDPGNEAMGSVTIRNLDDAVKRNARLAAAANGRSLEAELRALLERTYSSMDAERRARTARIRAMSGPEIVAHLIRVADGADLQVPPREAEDMDFPDL